jgi:pimeloyl-ACP methyl ester carboxylesterase
VTQLLARESRRVRQLVLVGAVGLGIGRPVIELQPWRWVEDVNELRGIHTHNLLALMLKHAGSVDDVAIAIQDANVRRTRYVSKREAHGSGLADLLNDLDVPVHGIWGDADPTADGQVAQVPTMLADLHPGAGCDLIPDCGHWAMWERPDDFNRLLLQALGDTGPHA